jgi:inositol transport system ATP-binding protein
MAVSDRIVTFREGRITGVMSAAEATEEKLMQRMALGAGEHHVHAEAA